MTPLHIPTIHTSNPITICWLRRDLRIDDHHALCEALKNHPHVLPLFIFDTDILDDLSSKQDARVHFLHAQLSLLTKQLEKIGSTLLVLQGPPLELFKRLTKQYTITAVYTNEDYEPYATKRDHAIQDFLATHNIPFYAYKDQVIFAPDEILKQNGSPYTVYTPYMKQWKAHYQPTMTTPYPVAPYHAHLLRTLPLPLPSLKALGFQPTPISFPPPVLHTSLLRNYAEKRDILASNATSHLGIHLRFGTLSIRQATQAAYLHSDTWLQQLIWRNFFMMILAHFPSVVEKAFKPAYDHIPWLHDTQSFQAWCQGQTGYPIVDAGMRELNTTGFMHNRARMITASFLTKLLLIDWRWGEAYFAEKLLDYELSSNNGNWQWAAGTGCDAAPYFRIFNPMRQTQRFDPSLQYIKKWVPEYTTPQYPKPIVDYAFARKRALQVYQKALRKSPQ